MNAEELRLERPHVRAEVKRMKALLRVQGRALQLAAAEARAEEREADAVDHYLARAVAELS